MKDAISWKIAFLKQMLYPNTPELECLNNFEKIFQNADVRELELINTDLTTMIEIVKLTVLSMRV